MATWQQAPTRSAAQRIIRRRVAARAIDVFLAAAGSVFFFYVGVTIYVTGLDCVGDTCGRGENDAVKLAGLTLMFVSLVFPLLYESLLPGVYHTTPGKTLAGLRVQTISGARPDFWRGAWRATVMWLPSILFTALAGSTAGTAIAVLMWVGAAGALLVMLALVLTGGAPFHDRRARTEVVSKR